MDVIDHITPPIEVGKRAVIRHRLAPRQSQDAPNQAQNSSDQTQGASATDTLGVVTALDVDHVVILDRDQHAITIDRSAVVAARRLALVSRGRDPRRASPQDLQRLATAGWVAEQEPLGDWTLRSAAGFTARANSCLIAGDPGCDLDEALARICGYAAEHEITPMAQTIDGSPEQVALREHGWSDTHKAAVMMTIRLVDLIGPDPGIDPTVEVSTTLSQEWLEAYLRTRPTDVDQETVRRVLSGSGPQAYATVRQPGAGGQERPVAVGKAHVQADWIGLSALWTTPEHRQQGLMTTIVTVLGAWAAGLGARSAYLQVEQSNDIALASYEKQGWAQHHTYAYLRRPDPSHR